MCNSKKKTRESLYSNLINSNLLNVFISLCEDMADKGRPLPKFGEWDVNDPASAEGFTVIFNKARNEKKAGSKPQSPTKEESAYRPRANLAKPQSSKWFCCVQPSHAES